jgi:hypothetical protein
MRRSTVVLAVVAVGILATIGLSAQEKPNFTGNWKVPELPAAPGAEGDGPRVSLGSGWGESFTLIQDSDVLTVERVLYRPRDYQPTMKLRYALDGSESRNTLMMGRGLQVQESTASWESDKLVITTVHTVTDVEERRTVRCEVTQSLSLQPPRQAVGESSLVIETRRCGVLGGLPSTTRTVYDRQ